jgi:hypothetical protein
MKINLYRCNDDSYINGLVLQPLKKTVDEGFDEGCEATFVQLNKAKGIKVFLDKSNAKRALSRQRKASYCNLGPKVHSEKIERFAFNISTGSIFIQWGYVTQVAKIFKNESELDYFDPEGNKVQDLMDRLRKIGCGHDLHYGNVGLLNKKLVCIDFGDIGSGIS